MNVDYQYYENGQCGFADLKEAAEQLTSATQEQFEQLKKEKWFHRVFDMVTFSKKNEKRVANQIGSLTQAQQIMMEILVRLSERDERISDLVQDAFDKIERLSRNDILLAKRLNLLENRCLLGITKESDIDNLSETEGIILSGLMLYFMHQFGRVSEDQQRYANNILTYLDVDAQEIDIEASLNSIKDIDIKKKLLTCCLEYCFLNNYSFDLADGVEEIIDEFDFGSKTVREVKKKILNIFKLRGADGLIDKYGHYEEIEEEFYVELPDDDIEEEGTAELEEMNITSILHIPRGQTKVFKNKIVHISTYINCEGTLEFDGCIVYYNKPHAVDEITVEEGAAVKFINCQVNCLEIDKNPFIQGAGKNEFLLIDSEFNDCSHFLQLSDQSNIVIQNCNINTPGENFILDKGYEGNTKAEIANTHIYFLKNDNVVEEKSNLFQITPRLDGIMNINGTANIYNCLIQGIKPFEQEKLYSAIFNIKKAKYKNCTFKNVGKCIQSGISISECIFENCSEIYDSYYMNMEAEIKNNLFKNCTMIVSGFDVNIKNCQFVECRNRLVEGKGRVTIEFCEFYNLVNDISTGYSNASLEFSCGKDTPSSRLSKCIFDGVKIGKGFLVEGNTYEKISGTKVFVEDCTFNNSTTERPSNVIVKQYSHYYGLFNREVETKPVSISNCKGLDKVNTGGKGRAATFVIRTATPAGEKIGALSEFSLAKLDGTSSKNKDHKAVDGDDHELKSKIIMLTDQFVLLKGDIKSSLETFKNYFNKISNKLVLNFQGWDDVLSLEELVEVLDLETLKDLADSLEKDNEKVRELLEQLNEKNEELKLFIATNGTAYSAYSEENKLQIFNILKAVESLKNYIGQVTERYQSLMALN